MPMEMLSEPALVTTVAISAESQFAYLHHCENVGIFTLRMACQQTKSDRLF